MPNIRNLAQAFSLDIVLTWFFYSYNGRVEKSILGPTEKKKYRFAFLFSVLVPCIKFQVPSVSHSLDSQAPKSVTDTRTRPKQYAP